MPDCGRKRLNIGYRRELVRGMDMPVRSTEATEKDLTPPRRLDEAHIGARRGAPAPELAWREAEAGAERMLPARPMRAVVRVDDRGEMANHLGLYRDAGTACGARNGFLDLGEHGLEVLLGRVTTIDQDRAQGRNRRSLAAAPNPREREPASKRRFMMRRCR